MKKTKLIVAAAVLAVSTSLTANAAVVDSFNGNGNDGCQIGSIPGHKDHGQSNEHKIDYMTLDEWEEFLILNQYTAERISNNIGSNGWVTYHVYNLEGKQIEVVHIRFKENDKPVPPIEEGGNEDNSSKPEVSVPPVEEVAKDDDSLKPEIPVTPVGDDASENNNQNDIVQIDEIDALPDGSFDDSNNVIELNSEVNKLPNTGGTSSLSTILMGIGMFIGGKKLIKK